MSSIGPIAQAIAEVSKLIAEWMKTAKMRRIQVALDSAERYIFANQKSGEYADITDKRRDQLLAHFSKRFFAYNN